MVISMEKARERRVEHRLQYRWPVRFITDGDSLPFQGQIVDISSEGMAFLCHSDQSRFDTGKQLKAVFGVPHFGSDELFDTILFERIGHVRRIDKPSSQVYRVAIQFASPLFFRPGEQGIDEIDIQQRLDTKNFSIIKAEETARAYDEALTKAQKQLRLHAQAKAKIEEKLKTEIEDRSRAQARLRAEAEEKIRHFAENTARLEEKLHAKEKEIAKFTAITEKTEKKIKSLEEQLVKVKEQAYKEITRIRTETADAIKHIKAKSKNESQQSPKKDLLKKVDDFISDRNKIF